MTARICSRPVLTATGTPLERLVGGIVGTIFSACYFYALLWIPAAVWVFLFVSRGAALVLAIPYVVSAGFPSQGYPWLLSTWCFKCLLKLHDYEEVLETSAEDLEAIEKEKKIIFAVQPHGVMSIGGICTAIAMAPKPTPPTAAANVIQRIPILKHVFGVFGLVGASSSCIARTLKTKSLALYVGGIAELFLSTSNEERLFIGKRKGFIKLAMRTGSEVVPCYYFGNTMVLEIIRHPMLTDISRKLGASITILFGRWGLPVPKPCKVLCVTGRPLGLPKKEFPSQEDVDKYHTKYMTEVKRLFDTYKGRVVDYKDKELIIDT